MVVISADCWVLVHAAEVTYSTEFPFTSAGKEDHFVGLAPMTTWGAFIMRNFLVFPTLLADTLAVPFVFLLAGLAETGTTTQAYLGAGGLNGQCLLITTLTVAEALSDDPFMLHANFLHTNFALITSGFFPWTIVADSRIRSTLGTDHQVFLGFYFVIFQEFLYDTTGNGGCVYFGVHHTS